jgi:signal transduction histidine kinase
MSHEERRRFLANISADTERLSQLVRRLLDLARADMASPQVDVAVDFNSIVRRIADAMSRKTFTVKADLPVTTTRIAVPEATVETVLTALIENARQAGATRVDIKARRQEGRLSLSVADNGPGIPPADRARVFEPFFTSRRAEGGSGLGLSIARSLLAASKGEIAVGKSETGARFDIKLPLAPGALFSARQNHGGETKPARRRRKMDDPSPL